MLTEGGIPGSNINRKVMPKTGKWKEISLTLCCDFVPIVLPSFLGAEIQSALCLESDPVTLYFNGSDVYPTTGDTIFSDATGTSPVGTGFINNFPRWVEVENGVVISYGECGR